VASLQDELHIVRHRTTRLRIDVFGSSSSGSDDFEWATEATIYDKSVTYAGVTMLAFRNDKITRSCAYFNPAAIAAQLPHQEPTNPQRQSGKSGESAFEQTRSVPRSDARTISP
jgi:hypothetical protein